MKMGIVMNNESITCMFCNETDFDWIGLKRHIIRGWCTKFEKIPLLFPDEIKTKEKEIGHE